jgi:hypothetical protein
MYSWYHLTFLVENHTIYSTTPQQRDNTMNESCCKESSFFTKKKERETENNACTTTRRTTLAMGDKTATSTTETTIPAESKGRRGRGDGVVHDGDDNLTSRRHVVFDTVHVFEFRVTLGDNPACRDGCPIRMEDECIHDYRLDVDTFEKIRSPYRRRLQELYLTVPNRACL